MAQAISLSPRSTDAAARALGFSSVQHATPVVFVVDDDIAVRESLESLIDSAGWQAETFASAREFFARPRALSPSCLVLDVVLPDLSGLDLQARISSECIDMPIIFITGYGDVPMAVQAMKGGAFEFLTKPFRDDVLLGAIEHALELSSTAVVDRAGMWALRERHALLTHREREVMELVVAGEPNKQVGRKLGITEYTVKVHRGKVMRKMNASSLPHLVEMVARLRAASEQAASERHLMGNSAIAWPVGKRLSKRVPLS
jgi:FixJ family two-component response regulator